MNPAQLLAWGGGGGGGGLRGREKSKDHAANVTVQLLLAMYLMFIEPSSRGLFASMLPATLLDSESVIYASLKGTMSYSRLLTQPAHVYG